MIPVGAEPFPRQCEHSRAVRTVWVAPMYGTECCVTNVKVWVGGV